MLLPKYDELVELKNKIHGAFRSSRKNASAHSIGQHRSLFKGRGLDFSEFREYQGGDDIRSIDWKVTARTGRAHTKVFTEEREKSVFILVDMNRSMQFGTRKTFKSVQAARAAALIAWRAHDLKDKVGSVLFGNSSDNGIQFLKPKRTRQPIWDMFNSLCSDSNEKKEVSLEEALTFADQKIPSGSSLFLISDFYEIPKGFAERLGLISKRCDVTLIKITDPADYEMPSVRAVRFKDEKGGMLAVNTSDETGAVAYRKLWEKNDAILVDGALATRSKIIRLSTLSDVPLELFGSQT